MLYSLRSQGCLSSVGFPVAGVAQIAFYMQDSTRPTLILQHHVKNSGQILLIQALSNQSALSAVCASLSHCLVLSQKVIICQALGDVMDSMVPFSVLIIKLIFV